MRAQTEEVTFTCGENIYITVVKNKEISFALNQPQKKRVGSAAKIFSTAIVAGSFCVASSMDKVNSSLEVSRPISIEEYSLGKATESYIFSNRNEVNKFIDGRSDIKDLLKSLPIMVADVLGEAKMSLSIFADSEENWKNLCVEIETNRPIEEFGLLEEKLFALFEENEVPDSAIADVTISFI